MAATIGTCVNYHECSRFEHPVAGAREGDRCDECNHRLLHVSGLTWADARDKGYATAGEVPGAGVR